MNPVHGHVLPLLNCDLVVPVWCSLAPHRELSVSADPTNGLFGSSLVNRQPLHDCSSILFQMIQYSLCCVGSCTILLNELSFLKVCFVSSHQLENNVIHN